MSTVETVKNVIDTTEVIAKNANIKFNKVISVIVTFVISQSTQFLKFLVDKNVVSVGIAIIVGSQIGKITGSFVDYILSPLVNLIIGSETKHLEEYEFEFYGMSFKLGLFLSNFIQFLMNMVMVYYVFKFSQISNLDALVNQSVDQNVMFQANQLMSA